MGRLFWKIFLWFWAAMILMGFSIAWAISTMIDISDLDSRHRQFKRMLQTRVETLAQVLEYNGERAAKSFLIRSQRHPRAANRLAAPGRDKRPGIKKRPRPELQMYVINTFGIDLLQRQLPEWIESYYLEHKENANTDQQLPYAAVINKAGEIYFMTASVRAEDGAPYTIIARLVIPEKPELAFEKMVPFGLGRIYERHPQLMQLRIGLALLLSSLFCFGLSWYLVKPMKLLRTATRKLAAGQLDTRVADLIGKRGDELESLGIDFDYMAERIQTLLGTQQNLLNDVSHELRSPLARLQVAVGLAQQKNDNQITEELERIELESMRLNDLLEQVLTLARLDSDKIEQQHELIDLVALLENIATDARFEAANDNKHVIFQHNNSCSIHANLNLLHRAIENIVRNAVKYTADQTNVVIDLTILADSPQYIMVKICDSGDGVPDSLLPRLFEPFFRVASARDRNTGGYGLGLAIAKRAVSAHQGTINAFNRIEGGLCVCIQLPVI